MSVNVKWRREGDVAIAFVGGRIDSASADDFRELVEEGLEVDDKALILDMKHVGFMSSAGLRVCLLLLRRMGRGKLALSSLTEMNRDIVTLSGLDKFIPMYPSVTDAVRQTVTS